MTSPFFGDGPIGLLALQVARAFGARSIVVVGATTDRLVKASELGADAIVDVRHDDVEARLRSVFCGTLPNVIIEASGNPAAAEQAVAVLAAGGRMRILGLSRERCVTRS